MISCYSSAMFLASGRHIVTRDYIAVKIWDIANAKRPVATVTIQDSLKSKLCECFENDAIFDKFSMTASSDSNTVLTGNYNNSFHLIDIGSDQRTNTQYELSYKKQTIAKNIVPGKMTSISKMDYQRKTIASDFHPKKNVVAIASLNCFFLYGM